VSISQAGWGWIDTIGSISGFSPRGNAYWRAEGRTTFSFFLLHLLHSLTGARGRISEIGRNLSMQRADRMGGVWLIDN
jgi:hypothetical protein